MRQTLESPTLKQLVQRIRLRFHLGPLDRLELQEYITHRLKVAGRETDDLFDEGCYDVIYRYAGGVPRLINTLCDTALLCAFADDKKVVEVEDLRAAIEELGWQEHESTTGVFRALRNIAIGTAADLHITQIEVQTDGETVSVHSFPQGRVIVGRSPDNEIYIKSKFVSRHHAQLVSDEDGCMIEDLNSTNGMFIDEKQIKKRRLRDGDVISLGVHQIVYTDLREVAEPTEADDVDDAEDASNTGT